jgi:adenine-specific DNA-methyltransferase
MKSKKLPNINFIGNKEKIATWISKHFPKDAESLFDAFSGGASISFEAKKKGMKVVSNDILYINYLIAKSLIENNGETLTKKDVETVFRGKPIKGFMYKNYANVYFYPKECMELDLYRKNIAKLPTVQKKAIALTLMRRAMVRKMPYSRFNIRWEKIVQLRDEEYSYSKYKRKRAYHNESFKKHFIDNLKEYQDALFDNGKKNKAFNMDAFDAIKKVKADIIYLDPPYAGTMNNYFEFYGAIDEYIKSKKLKPFKNNFIDRAKSLVLFEKLFSNLKNYKYWLLSYNNSSYPSKQELLKMIKKHAHSVKVVEKPHVYKITGKEKKEGNIEYLFIVDNSKPI